MVRTSVQTKDYLLCFDCEQRFNNKGEKWVLAMCRQQSGVFPLAESLALYTPFHSGDRTSLFRCDECQSMDAQKLIYFAASMFWRASIYRPPYEPIDNPVELGPLYEEQFRQYLLDLVPFPRNAVLWVTVIPQDAAASFYIPPRRNKQVHGKKVMHAYTFALPGIMFDLYVGKEILPVCREFCIVGTPGHVLIQSYSAADRLKRDLISALPHFSDAPS
jgi:hypothetical protein